MDKRVSDMYKDAPLETVMKVELESKISLGSVILEAEKISLDKGSPRIVKVDGEIYIIDKTRTAKTGEWGIRKDSNGSYVISTPEEYNDLWPILFTTDNLTGHHLRIKKPNGDFGSVEILPHKMEDGLVKTIYNSCGVIIH